ncbi:MAG: aminotransferase class I/II-fold pyridoxal phosphate-dependent enzyme [Phycisphaerales bacterium]|nr:aminotransferase class I/II-fold pyridoxal phosphate-dependent enzyme [Phycisphaerales bacterium]
MNATPSTASPTQDVQSARLRALPTYLFHRLDKAKAEYRARGPGKPLIDLGVGDPDRPTPDFIVSALRQAVKDPATHRYPASKGSAKFRQAAARFMDRRFGVSCDPDRHILACIGSKEGIAHLPLAVVDSGRAVLCPSLGYPVYHAGAVLADARPVNMPMREASGWTPLWEEVSPQDVQNAALMWVNYPNNPTGASVPLEFYAQAATFARDNGIMLASDQAYSELYYSEVTPDSLWKAKGLDLEADPFIEFHSLSKGFNMTGWRIGFAVGNRAVIDALAKVKGPIDSGVFSAVQEAGIVALENYDHEDIAALRAMYTERLDATMDGVQKIGAKAQRPGAGLFIWAQCPKGPDGEPMDSWDFAMRCIDEAGVSLVPGAGFGDDGTHWFRIAMTVEAEQMAEAFERLAAIDWTA